MYLLKCLGTSAKLQRARLDAFLSVLTVDAEALIHQEKMYCAYAYAVGITTEDDQN